MKLKIQFYNEWKDLRSYWSVFHLFEIYYSYIIGHRRIGITILGFDIALILEEKAIDYEEK